MAGWSEGYFILEGFGPTGLAHGRGSASDFVEFMTGPGSAVVEPGCTTLTEEPKTEGRGFLPNVLTGPSLHRMLAS